MNISTVAYGLSVVLLVLSVLIPGGFVPLQIAGWAIYITSEVHACKEYVEERLDRIEKRLK